MRLLTLLAVLLFGSCTIEPLVECYTTYKIEVVQIDGEVFEIPRPITICDY